MITIDKLAAYGADTQAGLSRCMNNEAFYLRLVGMELGDANFDRLRQSLTSGDTRGAFEAAHAIKGAVGNLALTPIYTPVAELTEKLRGKEGPVETGDLLRQVLDAFETLKKLAD